jgi:GT2 family glycosyltransferase
LPGETGSDGPVLSVVIPSYNGAHVIGDCVAALVAQEAEFAFEVIVVDSSSDGTVELLRGRFPQVRLIHFEQQTAAPRARNIGIGEAGGEIIGLMDQDCIADPGWVQGMVQAHRAHPEVLAVAGGIRPANPRSLWGLANFYLEFREFNHIRPPEPGNNWITCNVSVKRELFAKYGLFPEDLWPGDDVIVAQSAAAAGEKARFAPELSIAHVNRGELRRILPHARKLGWASARIRKLLPTVPDAWMVRRPWSAWLVPLARPLRVLWCFLKWRPVAALKALPLLPAMVLICCWWARGFMEGAREP